MEFFGEIIVAVVCAGYFVAATWALRSFRSPECFWLNPLVVPIAVWSLSYPLWALTRGALGWAFGAASVEDVTVETRLLVVLFAALFIVAVGIGSRAFPRLRRLRPIETVHIGPRERLRIHGAFLLVGGAWVVRFWTGSTLGLYEDFEQLTHSIWENIVGMVSGGIWLVLPACMIAYALSRRKAFLLESLFLTLCILAYALMSTSKGSVAQLALMLLMVRSALGRGRVRSNLGVAAAAVGLFVIFGVYSYELRERAYGMVRGLNAYDTNVVAGIVAASPPRDVFGANFPKLLERVTGYGDGLAKLIQGDARRGEPLYALGSLVEVGNLIPRFVWKDRPHLSFNHHVTVAVWGLYGLLSESPIGRLGEAFYVAGWGGLVYGVLYGAMFSGMTMLWAKLRSSVWGAAFFISILLVWVTPDAYLLYNLKPVVFLTMMWFVGSLFRDQRTSETTAVYKDRISQQVNLSAT